jgi:hypothetical protein
LETYPAAIQNGDIFLMKKQHKQIHNGRAEETIKIPQSHKSRTFGIINGLVLCS